MKKFFVLFNLLTVMTIALQAQKVTNHNCRLDNGIVIKTEQTWGHVWVDQRFAAMTAADQGNPVAVSVRTLGTLTSASAFKLYSAGKEVSIKGAKQGTYTMKMTYKLSGKPGTLSFDIDDIVIKPQTKTSVSVTLYDYQIMIDEKQGTQNGLAHFESKVERYKGNPESNPECGPITFYVKGNREKPVAPAEATGKKTGRIKPGTYDVLITLGTQDKPQRVWLENFAMKPDVSYSITTNLNAGVVTYAGVNKEVKAFHLYPAGTADKQQGKALPERNLEILRCETQGLTSSCPPGTYDVLLGLGSGAKYEWRKGIAVQTGTRVQVK